MPTIDISIEQSTRLHTIGFILAFLCAPAGVAVSVLALRRAHRTGARVHGFAIAGVVVGATLTALAIYIAGVILVYETTPSLGM